jgi:hypothetical protein
MTLQIYNSTSVGTGIRADLGTTDDAYVDIGVIVGSTDNNAILGSGSNQAVVVDGRVVGQMSAISLGSTPGVNHDLSIAIEESGSARSVGGSAVAIFGYASTVTNSGIIEGDYGLVTVGNAKTGTSKLVNDGEISSDGEGPAVYRGGSEDYSFTNNGLVSKEGGEAYGGYFSTGNQTLINNGKMVGNVYFGEGNDIYAGVNGKVTGGDIAGGSGNDRFTGGKYAEFFEGDAGRDILKGGGGADHFDFIDVADSTVAKTGRDLIQDFSHAQHDRLDVVSIDAKASSSTSDQNFSFVGTHAFSGAEGELRYNFKGSSTFVQGDTDGDRHADFAIELKGHIALHAGDFML